MRYVKEVAVGALCGVAFSLTLCSNSKADDLRSACAGDYMAHCSELTPFSKAGNACMRHAVMSHTVSRQCVIAIGNSKYASAADRTMYLGKASALKNKKQKIARAR